MASALPLSTSGLAVGRARLSGPGASRSLLEQALGEVALDRLGLGPEEVLYIPRLAGPARLRAGASRHFANGLGLALGEIAGRAERDPVGGSATDRPCRFSSRAAFAAWLIGAVLAKGSAEAATMVRAATGRASPQDWWRRELLSEGRRLVPVLARLAEAGKAAHWLGRLDAFEVELATASLARDYGLALAHVVGGNALSRASGPRPMGAVSRPNVDVVGHASAADKETRVACQAIAARGEPVASLPVAARRLLIAAVVLARVPAAPRDALARAIAHRVEPGYLPSIAPIVAVEAIDQDSAEPPTPRRIKEVTAAAHVEATIARALPPLDPPRRPIVTSLATGCPPDARIAATQARATRADLPIAEATAVPGSAPAPHVPRNPFADPSDEHFPATLVEPRTALDTAFGGLAFLVNAFLAMGLYPDFTRPLDPALPLPPLALVDRLGLHWFGARYRRDPLHRWIARRGVRGALPRRWRVERAWLDPFPGGRAWHDGSTLWHAGGFPLATRIAPAPARRLGRTLEVSHAAGAHRRSARGGLDHAWLDCLALFLAARFRRAAPDDALTPAALAIPARVVVSEARLDFHFALGTLPFALRLAGLDRDPGWLPTEGRDLRFHFE